MKIIKWNGEPITKPGIYRGIPLEVYHSAACTDGPAVSSSNLRTAWNVSLRHMFAAWAFNPNRPEGEEGGETKFMRFGRGAHHLFLGEDDFSTLFIQQPETYRDTKTAEEKPWSNNANWCKAWNRRQEEAGRTILKKADYDRMVAMSKEMALNPLVMAGGLNGLVEHSLVVKDKETGLWLKWRPDVIPNDGDYVDLKCVEDLSDVAIYSGIARYGYNMQGGLGWEVCEQLGLPFTEFILLYVEANYPHCVRDVPMPDEDLSRGRLQCRAMLRKIRSAMDSGYWPGPGEGQARPIGLPQRDREAIDKRLQYEGGQ